MPLSASFLEYVLEQLAGLGPVRARRMFGGAGLYHEDAFFAVLDDDVAFFRVDDATRPAYERAGSRPFSPIAGQQPMRGYYEVPADVLDDREAVVRWAGEAVGVARAARARKRDGGRSTSRNRGKGGKDRPTPGQSAE